MAKPNIFCRIGIHRWKPVARRFFYLRLSHVDLIWDGGEWDNGWTRVGSLCKCCGKRKPY